MHMSTNTSRWFAIRVKSNREHITAQALRGKAYEVCLPVYRKFRPSGGHQTNVPLFSGYLFCQFNPRYRLPVLTVPGVVHIVGFGNEPQPVDASEMESILSLIRVGVDLAPHPYPPVGRKVQLREGPLRGVEGTILAHKGENKLLVSVSLLQRAVAVNVDLAWVDAVAQQDHSFAY
jgi:transcription antitermination factor NusG